MLKHEFVCKVSNPLPEDESLLDVVETKSRLNRLQLVEIKVLLELVAHRPQIIQVSNMQEAVLGSVIVEAGLDRVIIVKPVKDRFPRKLHSLKDFQVQLVVQRAVDLENVSGKGKWLRVESMARDIVITDGIVGGNSRYRWGVRGNPPVSHLRYAEESSRTVFHVNSNTVMIFEQ